MVPIDVVISDPDCESGTVVGVVVQRQSWLGEHDICVLLGPPGQNFPSDCEIGNRRNWFPMYFRGTIKLKILLIPPSKSPGGSGRDQKCLQRQSRPGLFATDEVNSPVS